MQTLDELLDQIGGFGRFQVTLLLLVLLPKILVGWSMLEMSFANYVPRWRCIPDEQGHFQRNVFYSIQSYHASVWTYDKVCSTNVTDDCLIREYESGPSVCTNEWDLVCERKWLRPLATSLQMAGLVVGSILCGQLSDLVGRRRVVFSSVLGIGSFNIVLGFSTSIEMFIVCRVLLGICLGTYFVVHLPYCMEFLSADRRALPGLIPAYHVGGMLLALAAWLTTDWRWVHWICGMAATPFALAYFVMPESLRWLAVRGREAEAMEVVGQVARWNGRTVPPGVKAVLESFSAKQTESDTSKKYSYIDIYNSWKLFKTSLTIQFIWFTMSLNSYGISFGASALGLNLYLNIFLLVAVTPPGMLVLNLIINKIGRLKGGALFFGISALCGIISLVMSFIVPEGPTRTLVTNVLCVVARGCLSTAWAAMMVLTNESYPTITRSLGYGAANVWARIGGVLAPFAVDFEESPQLAYGIVGVGCLLCFVGVMTLDETTGLQMKDTMNSTVQSPTETTGTTDKGTFGIDNVAFYNALETKDGSTKVELGLENVAFCTKMKNMKDQTKVT